MPSETGWQKRHFNAWHREVSPVVGLAKALARYAEEHQRRFDSPLADNYVLGAAWLDALRATRQLLNGDLGSLDGGTCDATLYGIARMAGFLDEDFQ